MTKYVIDTDGFIRSVAIVKQDTQIKRGSTVRKDAQVKRGDSRTASSKLRTLRKDMVVCEVCRVRVRQDRLATHEVKVHLVGQDPPVQTVDGKHESARTVQPVPPTTKIR